MDDDDVRRGRPAVHIEYNLPTAINAGDAMLAIAFEALASAEGLEPELLPHLVKGIGWMVRRVAEGQQLDIDFEGRIAVSEAEYLEMIEGKTAVMFLTCAVCLAASDSIHVPMTFGSSIINFVASIAKYKTNIKHQVQLP